MIRRYHLIDCLGRSVRPKGYTTAQGAHLAAKRRQRDLLDLFEANFDALPVRGADGNKLIWTIRLEIIE